MADTTGRIPSLADRYCNWYSCDRYSGPFLLRLIFRIGIIPVIIG
uniref:PsbJ n=1 Tax=Cabomba caroliniana TaxID=4426 RepID=A0A2U3TD84_CABCA|nr:PsbJ [Cabomba caroliniana]